MHDAHNATYNTKKTALIAKPDGTNIGVGRNHKTLPVSSKSSYKEGRYFTPHSDVPFALVCAVKHARQLHWYLTNDLQGDVVFWTRKSPNGDNEYEHPVRFDCNAPLHDIEGTYWRACWGYDVLLVPCLSHR